MVVEHTGTIGTVYPQSTFSSPSFYARVGDDYRIYIPKYFREALNIYEGDLVHVVVATVIRRRTIYVPGERD